VKALGARGTIDLRGEDFLREVFIDRMKKFSEKCSLGR
jgi:hypothetical protein